MLNIQNVDLTPLYDGAQQIVELYRQELDRQKVNASGLLSRTADFDVDFNDNEITVYLITQSYAFYIEKGRRPTGSGGGQHWTNPVGDIEQWLRQKIANGSFIPRSNKPIPRTPQELRSVSYAIVRKIHKEGFYSPNHQGKHILQNVLEQADAMGLIDSMVNNIVEAYENEVSVEIAKL